MKRLKLDTVTRDLVFQNGDLVFVDSGDSVAEALRSRLQTFRGEYFMDLEYGMPYYQSIFTDYPADNATLSQLFLGVLTGITDPSIESIEVSSVSFVNASGAFGLKGVVTLATGETLTIDG